MKFRFQIILILLTVNVIWKMHLNQKWNKSEEALPSIFIPDWRVVQSLKKIILG